MAESKETTIQYLPHSPFPLISYGLPFPEATAKHLTTTLNCKKAFIIVSGSLSRNTDALTRLESALGDKVVGIRKGMQPHTLLSEVLEVTEQFKASGADCLITLGGGSLVDAAKIVEFATSNNLSTLETLLPSMTKSMKFTKYGGATPPPWQENFSQTKIKIICITTTLSGGEYNPVGGGTDPITLHKQLTYDPSSTGPSLIIWDPELTKTTPLKIWLGTGLRGIDHCVEAFTSGPNVKSEAKEAIIESVKLLLPSLLRTKEVPDDLEARLLAQKGGMLSMKSVIAYGVPVGGSHGIGHQLGPLGVPHGETSAIMMPAVAKFNKKEVQVQQEELLEKAFWPEESVKKLLEEKGLKRGEADLGDVMDVVIRALDLPRSLKEFGVGRDRFQQIAENSVKDRCCWSNPIPLRDPKLVMEILEEVIVD